MERILKEQPAGDATPVEVMTWAGVLAEAGKKREAVEEEVGKAYHGIRIGSGWEVNEGKAMRTVEVTMHFWTPVTEKEKTKLPKRIGVVANLLAGLRKVEGKGVWNVKAAVDTQVCNNEITWTLSKAMRGTTEEEVWKAVRD